MKLLDDILAEHDRIQSPLRSFLRPGLERSAISERLRDAGLQAPEPLLELYARFDGVDADRWGAAGTDAPAPRLGWLDQLSLNDALEARRGVSQLIEAIPLGLADATRDWSPSWLPVFVSDPFYVVVDCGSRKGTVRCVRFSVLGEDSPSLIASSLSELLQDLLARLRRDEYLWGDESGLEESPAVQARRLLVHHWDRSVVDWVSGQGNVMGRDLWYRAAEAEEPQRGRVLSFLRPSDRPTVSAEPDSPVLRLRLWEPEVCGHGKALKGKALVTAFRRDGQPAAGLEVELVASEESEVWRSSVTTDSRGCATAMWPLESPMTANVWASAALDGEQVVSNVRPFASAGTETSLELDASLDLVRGAARIHSVGDHREVGSWRVELVRAAYERDLVYFESARCAIRVDLDLRGSPAGLYVLNAWATADGRRLTTSVPFASPGFPDPEAPLYMLVELDPLGGARAESQLVIIGGSAWSGPAGSPVLTVPSFGLRDPSAVQGGQFDPMAVVLEAPIASISFDRLALD